MKIFEDRLANLVKNVKFGRKQNKFQETLKKETQRIMADPRPLIAADKSSNYYFMESKDYKDLVEMRYTKNTRKPTIGRLTKLLKLRKILSQV